MLDWIYYAYMFGNDPYVMSSIIILNKCNPPKSLSSFLDS